MTQANHSTIPTDTISQVTIEVMRYRPDIDDAPWWQAFTIDWTQDMSILDALLHIKDHHAPDLAFRWSCRMEVCGSCGMVVNGVPKLACSTFVRDYVQGYVQSYAQTSLTDSTNNANIHPNIKRANIRIGALDQMPIEKDLIIDINPFIEKLESIKPYIIDASKSPTTAITHTEPPTAVAKQQHNQSPKQLAKFKKYTMCINCLLCYQACPQIGLNAEFLGPAVSALAHRYNLDSRDAGAGERFKVLNDSDGIWPCTFVGYCSEVCPKHVDPAGAIQQSKAAAIPHWAKSLFGA